LLNSRRVKPFLRRYSSASLFVSSSHMISPGSIRPTTRDNQRIPGRAQAKAVMRPLTGDVARRQKKAAKREEEGRFLIMRTPGRVCWSHFRNSLPVYLPCGQYPALERAPLGIAP
jgi:hypothetical protein